MIEHAEFIIHAGDMIGFGTGEEIRRAAECCGALPVPFYTVLGNHDCLSPDFRRSVPLRNVAPASSGVRGV